MGNVLVGSLVAGMLLVGCASAPVDSIDDARRALAPTGRLRVALFEGNAVHAIRDRKTGEVKGVSYELGRELAARLGVPYEPVLYAHFGEYLEAGKAGKWDAAFMGVNTERRASFDYTEDHLQVEYGYLVPAASPVGDMAQVDRAGVRIAVVERGSPDAFLTGALRNATLVRVASLPAAIEQVTSGKADLVAGLKPAMLGIAPRLPGGRVLDGSPGAETAALAIPKGRPAAALQYAQRFVAQAKAEGLVQSAISKTGVRGVVVAATQ